MKGVASGGAEVPVEAGSTVLFGGPAGRGATGASSLSPAGRLMNANAPSTRPENTTPAPCLVRRVKCRDPRCVRRGLPEKGAELPSGCWPPPSGVLDPSVGPLPKTGRSVRL
ncbi:hypothetical protein LH612_31570, partial [Klebsiella pneumoniae]|nr:hypothetical protein [Klebsiella pneumoniae]